MTRLQEMKLIAEGSERDRLELQKQLDAQRLRADTAEAKLAEMTDNFNIVVRQKLQLSKNLETALGLMQEFCDRVERGEVRSKATYAKFKAALNPSPEAESHE